MKVDQCDSLFTQPITISVDSRILNGNSVNSHSVCFALLCTVDKVCLGKEKL